MNTQVQLPNGEPLQLKLGMHVGEAYTGMLGTSPPHFQCAPQCSFAFVHALMRPALGATIAVCAMQLHSNRKSSEAIQLNKFQQLVRKAAAHLGILRRVIGYAAKMAKCLAEQGISNFLQVNLMNPSMPHALQPVFSGITGM